MAEFEDGSLVFGESKIIWRRRSAAAAIRKVRMSPSPAAALGECRRASEDAT
jgi:hypothetical protein